LDFQNEQKAVCGQNYILAKGKPNAFEGRGL
jgi:hypothetical protein